MIPVLYIFIIPFKLEHKAGAGLCSKIAVTIQDSSYIQFVDREQILNLLNSRKDSILGRPTGSISIEKIEKKISSIHEVKTVEAFFNITGALNIYVDQRNPIMRVIPDEGGDYLVDDEGYVFRKSTIYAPRLHIVGGDITISRRMLEGTSIFDTAAFHKTVLRDIYELLTYIDNDDFWSAQIDQIYVDSKQQIEMISRIGSHTIQLGSIDNYETKMRNLLAFYEQVLPKTGWNRYSTINIAFKDQIICKKKI